MQASTLLEQLTGRQYDRACPKYGFGQIQKVFHTALQQHLANAGSGEERHRIGKRCQVFLPSPGLHRRRIVTTRCLPAFMLGLRYYAEDLSSGQEKTATPMNT